MAYRRTALVDARLQASRDRLLESAGALLADGGYLSVTVDAVAARAGVATGSVYRHFPSKADLLSEVFRRLAAVELVAVRAAVRDARRPAAERITRAVTTFATRALRAPQVAFALLVEPTDAGVERERLAFRRAYRDVFAHVVEDGVRRGDLPPQDAAVTAAALVGAISEALVGPLSPTGRRLPHDTLVSEITDFCVRAIGEGSTP